MQCLTYVIYSCFAAITAEPSTSLITGRQLYWQLQASSQSLPTLQEGYRGSSDVEQE